MVQQLICSILTAVALVLPFSSTAQSQLTYTVNNGTVAITGYSQPLGPTGPLLIPDTINGLPVTDIQGMSFYQHYYITSVVIGNNVTNIGAHAFDSCELMNSLTMGNNVTRIGDFAFTGCANLTSVTIGSNVGLIDEGAFLVCDSLRFITIPASVTNVGVSAFMNDPFLTGIYFEGNMPILGSNAVESRIY